MTFTTIRLARVFKAIGNERRMNIIKLLAKDKLSVIDISQKLKLSFKSVSKHLQKLEREGVVEKQHQGRYMLYRLSNAFKKSGVLKQIVNSK